MTAYEGDFELAMLDLAENETLPSLKSVSLTEDMACHYTAERRVGRHLHTLWRTGNCRVMGNVPAYEPVPAGSDQPMPPLTLEILTEQNGSLRLPTAVRNRCLRHPVHQPEWLQVLTEFDAKHSPIEAEKRECRN